jgi:hypothetical protein
MASAESRAHFERLLPKLRNSVSSTVVRQTIALITGDLPEVRAAAQALPTIPLGYGGASGPDARTPEFDAAVEAFIIAVYDAIDRCEQHELAVLENATLPFDEYCERVLQFVNTAWPQNCSSIEIQHGIPSCQGTNARRN